MTETPWWQHATGYQIYPRSFQDSNGDGIGDLPGILSRLDHLADLGIGFVWLSPVYASPMKDMGYDISDYRAIHPEFGTMADFDLLVEEAGRRGIRIVMDLVVNHSSDQHDWFRSARRSREAPFRDYYIWRDPAPDGGPPNGIQSNFGGPAWTFDEATGQYYFHLFDPGQPDLNWENPDLRHAVYEMMRWWLDRGIAGFRMDVIDLIGKEPDRGITADGPRLHEYLKEMHREAGLGGDVLTVGEVWSATPRTALLYSGHDREELSMVFQFEHITERWHPERGKWQARPFDLPGWKRVMFKWQEALAGDGWNALFWSNHDLPRALSAFGDPGEHRVASARALAAALHLMKGTPYIYQGEEIGMINARFDGLDQIRDVEILNFHRIETERGMSFADFLKGANENGRDTARTPVHWSAGPQAGFSTGMPWIGVDPTHATINAEADRADPEGVFARYRHLAALRRERRIVSHGNFVGAAEEDPQVLAYAREHGGARLTVIANLSGRPARFTVPAALEVAGRSVLEDGAEARLDGTLDLAPWETRAVEA